MSSKKKSPEKKSEQPGPEKREDKIGPERVSSFQAQEALKALEAIQAEASGIAQVVPSVVPDKSKGPVRVVDEGLRAEVVPISSAPRNMSLSEQLDSISAQIAEYNLFIESDKRGAWKGDIIGSNCIDVQACLEEIYPRMTEDPRNKDRFIVPVKGSETPFIISQREVRMTEMAVAEWGRYIYCVLYTRPKGGFSLPPFYNPKTESILIANEDQLDGWDSDDGIVSLRSAGTNRYGRFEFATGYARRVPYLITELRILSWMEVNRMLVSDIGNVVQEAINVNPALTQILGAKKLEQPIRAAPKEREG